MSALMIINGCLPTRPVYIRAETWEVLANYAEDRKLNGRYEAGRLAYDAGIASMPRLLQNTVVELSNECEYLIDKIAAWDLSQNSRYLTLYRLGDNKPIRISYATLMGALRSGRVFDQLELTNP